MEILEERREQMLEVLEVLNSPATNQAKAAAILTIPRILTPKLETLGDHLRRQEQEVPDREEGIPDCDSIVHFTAVPHPDAEVMAVDILMNALDPKMPKIIRMAAVSVIGSDPKLIVFGMFTLLAYRTDSEIGFGIGRILNQFGNQKTLGGAYFLAAQKIAKSAVWFRYEDE